MRFKDFIKESIIDIPRRTYAPAVFDDADTKNPKIKPSVKKLIDEQIKEFEKEYPVLEISLIGSILTKRYRNDADLDINVLFDVPKEKQEDERVRLSQQYLSAKNPNNIQGKLIPGTKHPINFYFITDKKTYDDQNKKADAVFDIENNVFIKRPDDFFFDPDLYVKEFERKVQELDVVKGELKRDIIDYNELKELTTDDVLNLQEKIKDKLEEIEDSLEDIVRIGDGVDTERRAAFDKDMSPDEIRTYGVKNRLPKNVIYKMLEKYHYLKFYKKCKKILEDGIVTDKEVQDLEIHEAITLDDIKKGAKRFAKSVYDKIRRMATTSKRYEYAAKVLQDVIDRKRKERSSQGLPLRHDIGYYAAAVADTFHDINPKKLQSMVHEEYIDEAREKSMVFTFGRFNPPTIGHQKLIQKVLSMPANEKKIYLSRSQDSKKNPLEPNAKLRFMRDMFKFARPNLELNPTNMVLDLMTNIYKKGFTDVTMVVGSDRVREFENILTKYNQVKSRHGYYDFNTIKVVSAGERDPDAEGAVGMSASKMRDAAEKGDKESFKKGLPATYRNPADVDRIFSSVRVGMGLKAKLAASYGGMMHSAPEKPIVSLKEFEQNQIRDLYVREMIFNIGDKVDYVKEDIQGQVKRRGTNYVVLEDNNNNLHKAWIWDCIPIAADREAEVREYDLNVDYGFKAVSNIEEDTDKTPQDKTVAKKPGTQPKKYYKDLSKGEKEKRADFFKRQKYKKSDDEDDYKPAPGDKDAKTKPSKHTLKYKKMFGELRKDLQDACWKGYKQVGMKDKNGKQVPNCVPEAYDIGHDYAKHAVSLTPGQDGYDPNYQGGSYKPSDSKDNNKQVINRPETTDISIKKDTIDIEKKDIEEWAISDSTIDKYKQRYKEEWRSKLDEVVKRMMEKIDVKI
jgi:predicted nucleotidyltransferase